MFVLDFNSVGMFESLFVGNLTCFLVYVDFGGCSIVCVWVF